MTALLLKSEKWKYPAAPYLAVGADCLLLTPFPCRCAPCAQVGPSLGAAAQHGVRRQRMRNQILLTAILFLAGCESLTSTCLQGLPPSDWRVATPPDDQMSLFGSVLGPTSDEEVIYFQDSQGHFARCVSCGPGRPKRILSLVNTLDRNKGIVVSSCGPY